jgi:hypothetical protein
MRKAYGTGNTPPPNTLRRAHSAQGKRQQQSAWCREGVKLSGKPQSAGPGRGTHAKLSVLHAAHKSSLNPGSWLRLRGSTRSAQERRRLTVLPPPPPPPLSPRQEADPLSSGVTSLPLGAGCWPPDGREAPVDRVTALTSCDSAPGGSASSSPSSSDSFWFTLAASPMGAAPCWWWLAVRATGGGSLGGGVTQAALRTAHSAVQADAAAC